MTIDWRYETKPLSEIKPWGKNPRRIIKKGLEDLTRSIQKFGLPEPIVLNTDNTIIGGHARYISLKNQGVAEVFCAIPDRTLTEHELEELNVRLNKNVAGEFDFDMLANDFEVEDLIDWGFEPKEFGLDDSEQPELKTIELKSYKKIHVLLSFHPSVYEQIKQRLEELKDTPGVEYEQSAN